MNTEDRDSRLDRVLVGGREPTRVVIVASRADWPERFERERIRISDALGRTAERVEHIGSTSVAGLAAKPIIDVVVTVAESEAPEVRLALERAGYQLRVDEPGHRMFRTPSRDERNVASWTAAIGSPGAWRECAATGFTNTPFLLRR